MPEAETFAEFIDRRPQVPFYSPMPNEHGPGWIVIDFTKLHRAAMFVGTEAGANEEADRLNRLALEQAQRDRDEWFDRHLKAHQPTWPPGFLAIAALWSEED